MRLKSMYGCRREGGKDSELYVQALTYLVKRVSADAPAAAPSPGRKARQTKRERDSDDELSSVSEGEEDSDDEDDEDGDDGR